VLGPTHYRWHPDVRALVQSALAEHPRATANTYVAHPWRGWSRWSVDFWGPGGRGDPIAVATGKSIRAFLVEQTGAPFIRHWIWRHTLWTSFGGYSRWTADDHSGRLRHLHLTYWK
jgi:hypothetical protein